MGPSDFLDQVDVAVVRCDENGIATYLNERAAQIFEAGGGYALLGKDLSECHPGASNERFQELLKGQKLSAYTIEKNGQRKLIYQAPLLRDGRFEGYVEFGLPMPDQIPHFVRD